ncbi:MAG: KpsF/GutQ family sugar-phosphate isomerase [Alphaproteobacteria bacterium]
MTGDAEPANHHEDDPTVGDLTAAARVLRLEAEGLTALADRLGDDFVRAVDILHRLDGKLVVTGMGKSGHIASKLAATLSSTGTPAHYVHPGEASHGDLGMISDDDGVMALSNSGNTAELNDLIAYTRLRRLPLIAIVGREGSALGEAADVALVLPKVAEACPLGLAPTTSTTMMLGLGDALAVAVMERRGFSADQFQVLHPGGRLGRLFVKVEDVMATGDDLPLVDPDTPMGEALLVMTEKRYGCVGIVEGNRLAGIITDGDLRRHMRPDLLALTAGALMTRGPKTIRPKALAAEALGFMNANLISGLFVVEGDELLGIVDMHAILRAGIA